MYYKLQNTSLIRFSRNNTLLNEKWIFWDSQHRYFSILQNVGYPCDNKWLGCLNGLEYHIQSDN
jgi:hypothetical protein